MPNRHYIKFKLKYFFRLVFIGLFSLTALFSYSATFAATGVPRVISYQGRLTDSSGSLLGTLAGTSYFFKFSIWDNSTVGSGSRLWPTASPATTTVTVRQGVFNVNIGDIAGGYPDVLDYNFNTNQTIYLQVEVSSDNVTYQTLSPRQQIAATAFAQIAGAVSGTTTPSSFGTTTPITNSQVTIEATSTGSVLATLRGFASQVANLFQVQDSATTNLFSISASGVASTTALVVSNSFSQGGLTDCSLETQTVLYNSTTGRFTCGVDGTGAGSSTWATTTSQVASQLINYSNNSSDIIAIGSTATTSAEYWFDPNSLVAFISGNIGIGTTSPASPLSVHGNALISGDLTLASISATGTLLVVGSTTLQIFTALNSTTTNATTTNLSISGTASTSRLVVSGTGTSTLAGGVTLTSGTINIPTGSSFLINNANILSATTLGSSVVNSSLTSVGTLTSLTTSGTLTVTGLSSLNGGASTTNLSATNYISVGGLSTTTAGSVNTGTSFQILGTDVLTTNTLGTGILTSSLTSVGTLDSGSITANFGSINIGSDALTAGAGSFSSLTNTGALTNTGLATFNGGASTTHISVFGTSFFGGTATTTINSTGDLLVVGSTTLQNFTGLLSTTTEATTTNLFATRAVFTGATTTDLRVSGTLSSVNFSTTNLSTSGTLTVTGLSSLNGGASTTALSSSGSAFFATTNGSVGISTTSPFGLLSINPNGIIGPSFVVG
ncbi:MAG: hypothetical protein Q7S19_04165, partial [bacterium]|nr:hypothetical protein [bacterium]